MSKLRLNINGKEVTGYAGQTVLEVARENGIEIPTLCHDERVAAYGACGLCVVEQEGNPKLVRSCATVISEGMIIKTNTPKVLESRRTILELMFSDHCGDCRPPCALACPAGTDCQGYVGMVANGEYKKAVELVKDKYPFPSSIGRVCPHPCETACRRQLVEEPISIAFIKSFIGDKDLESGTPYIPEVAPATGHKVAVIGGGPAGLTAAYQLRRKGHEVTVFDAMPHMGGMLRYGIPEYRLPKAILQQEIDLIAGMGVEMKNNIKIGKDITFDSIKETFDAVIVAVGAWRSIKMGLKGEDNKCVYGGIDFLRKAAMNESIAIGENVAIVGGGNTAMDACRTAVRLGAKNVYCIYRRTQAEMPAEEIEIKEAFEEGVQFKFLTNPVEVISDENGGIKHVVLQKMELGEPDESGRRSPVPVPGALEELAIDSLIMALGQELDGKGLEAIELTKKGTISADESTFRTNLDNVFAVGDATNKGAGIAIAAIGEAEKAAKVVDSYLNGAMVGYKKPFLVERHDLTPEDFADRPKLARAKMAHHDAETRKVNFNEINFGFTEEQAVNEAKRCLECGCADYFECKLIKHGNSMEITPEKFEGENHVRTVDNTHPFIDRNPDKCILCGLCVRVCDEVMDRASIDLVGRGFDSIVKPELDFPLAETSCISCGQCINVCPTGALAEKTVGFKRVPLETVETKSACAFCSVGCNVTYHTAGEQILKTTPDNDNNGVLCARGRFGFEELMSDKRITKPMVRKNGVLTEVSFKEAYMYIAKQLQGIMMRGGKAIATASDKLTTEELFLIQKYAKQVLGTDAVSFSAIESGLKEVIGVDCSTTEIDALLSTDLIVLVGTDLMKDHAVLGTTMIKAEKRGARFAVLSNDDDTAEWDDWANMRLYSGEDLSVIKAIIKSLGEKGCKLEPELAEAVKDAVITEGENDFAEELVKAKKAIFVFDQDKITKEAAAAVTQMAVTSGHAFGARNGILQIKPNANSQALSTLGFAKADPSAADAMIIFGEDVKADLSGLKFLAVCDMYMTETAAKADVVLPMASLAEVDGTIINLEGKTKAVKAAVKPLAVTNIELIKGIANIMENIIERACPKCLAQEIAEKNALATAEPVVKTWTSFEGALYAAPCNTNAATNQFNAYLNSKGITMRRHKD
ncbi:MAG: FAD-dependent oxidoreductase [Firmicutes bacterium]|nr:FAD-dependent oxidoreductase [Bacillota bacterium]